MTPAVTLTGEDRARLVPLLHNACLEVHQAANPDSTILPDDAMALMDSYEWAQRLLERMGACCGKPPTTVDARACRRVCPLLKATATAEADDPDVSGRAKCSLCNHRCVSVAPLGTDLGALECPNCHRMTLEMEDE